MSKPPLRCAIYTRVSSDSGLEQEFNSLDAQRESAEAYIKSQAHEGWRLVRDRFDDGGFSGGGMDRPALQGLLQKIRERRIDVVVVYKVDRLTRSLADFAKLVELFDAHKVSFVSVTQSFNTTSSMGRLTLNVLLSFAQFEREVTGERIRDKIAASKKKGIWMGGVIPLGYRVEDRKLLVVETEANVVRLIFDLYLAHGSVRAVQRELKDRGLRSGLRVSTAGRTTGGVLLTNGPISHILHNRHYLGELNHKRQSWPAEHAAIVDPEIFGRVQEKLVSQRNWRIVDRAKSRALLRDKIFNEAGEHMTPTYAMKKGVRYHYYISVSAMQSRAAGKSAMHRVPAEPVEAIVVKALSDPLESSNRTNDPPAARDRMRANGDASMETANRIPGSQSDLRARELVDQCLDRVVIHSGCIEIARRDDREAKDPPRTLTIPWIKPTSNPRRELIEPETPHYKMRPMMADERTRLVRNIAAARKWLDELIEGVITDIGALAERERKTERSVRMTLSLAFLDPAIIKAACMGQLPRGYGSSRLIGLPPAFDDQWRALGLVRPV